MGNFSSKNRQFVKPGAPTRIRLSVLPRIKTPLRQSHLFIAIFSVWALTLAWFSPRLFNLLDAAQTPLPWIELSYFIVFVQVAWLYGIYNIAVVVFAAIARKYPPESPVVFTSSSVLRIPVAILYTTCNDFSETSAESCVQVNYPNYKVYILDDSSDLDAIHRIDKFATRFPDKVQVVRRRDRRGFKAGNLNHGLREVAHEPLFAIVDADEILPSNFLNKLVPKIQADPNCGFIQANHRCEPESDVLLKRDMRVGIDIHWKWYQPLRNKYGFVMFLGHGALLRRSCWKLVGGFPEIVSEDLAYAFAIREHGYYGAFAEDVVCIEEFPETVRAFRIRHVKWTRGTCELLSKYFRKIAFSKKVPLIEKLDILFPTLNLPLTMFFFLFMINASLAIPMTLGEIKIMTLEVGGYSATIPVFALPAEFNQLFTYDFFAITVVTIFAPVLCFIVEMWKKPLRLFRFLCHSTALYAALSPLSTLCVLGYLFTGKARFLVTGDKKCSKHLGGKNKSFFGLKKFQAFFSETHPDASGVRIFELVAAIVFLVASLVSYQVALFGLAIGFILMPVMHSVGWDDSLVHYFSWIPFSFIIVGILVGSMSLLGLQPVLFGFGFHF